MSRQLGAAQTPGYGSFGKNVASVETKRSNFVSSLGNFCAQYDLNAAGVAVSILSYTGYLGKAYSSEPIWAVHAVLPIVFLGTMIGMLTMGRLGDAIGRYKAIQMTFSLVILGEIIPACALGPPNVVYGMVSMGRLILGVGIGGIYPLSAVVAAESQEDVTKKSQSVATAFIFQNVGIVTPYIVASLMLMYIDPKTAQAWVPSLEFRLLFILGIIPAFLALVDASGQSEAAEFRPQRQGAIASLRSQTTETLYTLFGASLTWFLFDVTQYGMQIFAPQVMTAIFGTHQSLLSTTRHSALALSMGIPGAISGAFLVRKVGSKNLTLVGFLLLGVDFCIMATLWQHHCALGAFVGYCAMNFFIAWPAIGTYVIPAISCPMSVRTTCHGIAATSGKTGALVGTLMFPFIAKGNQGMINILWIQAGVCAVGALVCQSFLKHDWDYLGNHADDKAAII